MQWPWKLQDWIQDQKEEYWAGESRPELAQAQSLHQAYSTHGCHSLTFYFDRNEKQNHVQNMATQGLATSFAERFSELLSAWQQLMQSGKFMHIQISIFVSAALARKTQMWCTIYIFSIYHCLSQMYQACRTHGCHSLTFYIDQNQKRNHVQKMATPGLATSFAERFSELFSV